jgi:hypothetical protein
VSDLARILILFPVAIVGGYVLLGLIFGRVRS